MSHVLDMRFNNVETEDFKSLTSITNNSFSAIEEMRKNSEQFANFLMYSDF